MIPPSSIVRGRTWAPSYRSVIFYLNDEQKRIASAYIAQLDAAKVFPKPIVTQVTPLKGFHRAEDYHQDYALHHPNQPYVLICDRPKIEALRERSPICSLITKASTKGRFDDGVCWMRHVRLR